MKQVLEFLHNLSANNNKEWFTEHKDEYLNAKKIFENFSEQLISRIGEFDPTVRGLKLSDCTYRIYRDVRFSKDKRPYKTHFGCFVCRGGKKSGYGGYYFHIAGEEGDVYPSGHMLAAGNYCMESKPLQILREDIAEGEGDLKAILDKIEGFRLDEEFALKRPPRGYDDNTPYIDFIKYKAYCLSQDITTDYILSDNLLDDVAERFKATKPFLDYINRPIEYVREGNE